MEEEILLDIIYPDEEEMKAAQLACCGRVCKECETPVAYAWRKREVDMALLLEFAIENELTATEKDIVTDRWYNSLSYPQIAEKRNISASTARVTSERAIRKLGRVLRYAVFYQRNIIDESVVPATICRARVVAAARNFEPSDIASRIRGVRLSRAFSIRSVCISTGMKRKRYCEIEAGQIPEAEEIIILSEFFGVTADYILKGERND